MGSLEAQLQIRQNAQQVQDYVQDLFAWEKEIKSKGTKPKAAGAGGQQGPGSNAPAIRGKAGLAVGPAPQGLQQPSLQPDASDATQKQGQPSARRQSDQAAPHAAAHTYKNYSKWEQFDVDAALASSDDDQPSSSSINNSRNSQIKGSSSARVAPAPLLAQSQAPAAAEAACDMTPVAYRPLATRTAATAPTSATAPAATGTTGKGSSLPASAAPTRGAAGAASRKPASAADCCGKPTTHVGWRERGNTLFTTGHYAEAVVCYDRSLALEPTPQAYANRALAALKQGRPADAEADCAAAIALDPSYVKAHHRRGSARLALGQPAAAAADFEAGLRWEPANKTLAVERARALEAVLAAEGLAAAPALPLQRLQVVAEVAAVQQLEPAAAASSAPAAVQAAAAMPADEAAAPATSSAPHASPTAVRVRSPLSSGRKRIAISDSPPSSPDSSAAEGAHKALNTVTLPRPAEPMPAPAAGMKAAPAAQPQAVPAAAAAAPGTTSPVPHAHAPATSRQQPVRTAPTARAPAAAAAAAALTQSGRQLRPPKSSVEFEAAWRSFGSDQQLQVGRTPAKYLGSC